MRQLWCCVNEHYFHPITALKQIIGDDGDDNYDDYYYYYHDHTSVFITFV